jgi:hypothetical protein
MMRFRRRNDGGEGGAHLSPPAFPAVVMRRITQSRDLYRLQSCSTAGG